jgi:predicted ABC-type ATPase
VSEEALLRAAQEASDAAVDDAIRARQDVMVETVLSSRKFEATVLGALGAGYEFGFAYVTVRSAELNVQRVALRVEEGGHDVPEDRIRSRRERSREAVTWFASRAAVGLVIDNSGVSPVVLAEKRRGGAVWDLYDLETLGALGIRLSG